MVNPSPSPALLTTRRGPLLRSTYIPRFVASGPLDGLIRAYFPVLAPAALVDIDAAPQLGDSSRFPLVIDAGTALDMRPLDLLDRQERYADVALSLGLSVAPGLPLEAAEALLEQSMTNARWAIDNRRRCDLPILAALPIIEGAEIAPVAQVADGVALIGAEAWAGEHVRLLAVVAATRAAIGTKPLMIIGLDDPALLPALLNAGADLVAGHAHVALAAAGKLWEHPMVELAADPADRLSLAICNLAAATRRSLPLSVSRMVQRVYSLPRQASGPL